MSSVYFMQLARLMQSYVKLGKDTLKIVVSGKVGVGKTSLVNGLFGEDLALEMTSARGVTPDINEYRLTVNASGGTVSKNVSVSVFDCPGFGDPLGDDGKTAAETAQHCEDADLLIYCMDMRTRMSTSDTVGIDEFTKRVGEDVWKKAMFVLTFANKIPCNWDAKPQGWLSYLTWGWLGSSDPTRKEEEEYERLLEEWKETIPQYLREKMILPEEIVSGIPIIPAGYRNHHPVGQDDWFSLFWFTAFGRVKEDARPALLSISLHRFKFASSSTSEQADIANEKLSIHVSHKKAGGKHLVGGIALGAVLGAAVAAVGRPSSLATGAYAAALAGAGFGGGTGGAAGLALILRDIYK